MPRKRPVSREEETLWRKVTGDVEPLSPELPQEPPKESEARPAKVTAKKSKAPAGAPPPATPAPPAPPAAPAAVAKQHPELAPGKTAGLDKRNAQRLKRGQLRPEARVDLHGMTQAQAHAELNDFIAECRMAGLRSVLVITGKGSVREGGVLRRMVPRWLNQAPLRGMVIAIEQAIPRDGGAGAFYLLLRRRK
ncbi:MAG TPA: Smr/MutS family protein [Alphaproteobacteria bacterium]|jgi:DNA-nicking Smr family endonuclease|nr:Smr/MutS family protein [Alphaproteobacteria bacterium]